MKTLHPGLRWLLRLTLGVLICWLAWVPMTHLVALCLPISWEIALGRLPLQEVGQESADPVILKSLNEIGNRLVAQTPRPPYPITFVLIPSASVNAYAVPGGKIVLYSGLVRVLQNEDELAGVMAHEIEHLLLRHALQSMVGSMALPILGSYVMGNFHDERPISRIVERHFDREQELEADREGFRRAAAAGFSLPRMLGFFERSVAHSSDLTISEFASSHPTDTHRLAAAEELAKSTPPRLPGTLLVDWNFFQKHVRQLDEKTATAVYARPVTFEVMTLSVERLGRALAIILLLAGASLFGYGFVVWRSKKITVSPRVLGVTVDRVELDPTTARLFSVAFLFWGALIFAGALCYWINPNWFFKWIFSQK